MHTHPRSTASLADVRQLTYFRIYKTYPDEDHGTIRLFSNGNQQCPIKVGLIAADADENPIPLTDDEIRSALTLIFYDDGNALDGGYTSSFEKNRFTWIESAIPVRRALESGSRRNGKAKASRVAISKPLAGIQTATLYVSAAHGSPGRALAARFQVTPNLFFTTSPSARDSKAQVRDGDFDSSVEVLLAEPPFLSVLDFGAASDGTVQGRKVGDSTTYFYWATEYYLNPKFNGSALPLDSVGLSASVGGAPPKGVFGFYTHGDFFAHVQWGISYYSQPGGTTVEPGALPMPPLYSLVSSKAPSGATEGGPSSAATTTRGEHDASPDADLPQSMYQNCVGHVVGADKHRVVIGILKGNLPREFRDVKGGAVPDAIDTVMHILDSYGNEHTLSLSYDASADELTIG
jgi:hypothetical protein